MDSRVDKQVTIDTLNKLAELVLKNNIFEFSGKTYKQIRGTATGTKFAPPCAVPFMAALKEKILNKVKKKPNVWWRYIDDIFFIWEHGQEYLKELINEINSFHPNIKFTADWSKEKVKFLDVEMLKLPLRTVYCQPICLLSLLTHINFYILLPATLIIVKKGILYSQTLKLNRIWSGNSNFDKRCNKLESWLFEKGYSKKMVRKQVLQAREHSRESLLEKVKSESKKRN